MPPFPPQKMELHLIVSQTVMLENYIPQQIEIPATHKRKHSNDIWNDMQETKTGFKIVFGYC